MKKGLLYLAVVIFSVCTLGACKAVSYTHLTLPTNSLV